MGFGGLPKTPSSLLWLESPLTCLASGLARVMATVEGGTLEAEAWVLETLMFGEGFAGFDSANRTENLT